MNFVNFNISCLIYHKMLTFLSVFIITFINLSLNKFINNYLPNSNDENMFDKDISINPKYNSFKKKGIIVQIFDEHWEEVYSNNKDIIDKMRPNADTKIR